MKEVTAEEKIAFFKAMKKNNLSYREVPRTQEEMDNLVFVHNSATKQYYSIQKGTKLSDEEQIVTPLDIFSHISEDIDVITNEKDDYTM